MKIIFRILQGIVLLILLATLGLYLTGNGYLIKGIRCTYLRGETSATIDDYQFFSHRKVEAATKPIPWPVGSDYNIATLSDTLLQTLSTYESIAFLVIKGDSIRQEHYWDGYGKHSLSNSFSMAKTVVSMLTLIAIQEGKITGLSQKVIDFIPELKGAYAKDLEVQHLLRMCSGLDWTEHYTSPFSVTAKAYYTRDLEELIMGQGITSEPGAAYHYKSGNTQLMALVLQRATGQELGTYLSEKLWNPLGAESDALWTLDKEGGLEKAYCCLNSNATDFARFGQLFLDSGNFFGTQIIDTNFVIESLKPTQTKEGITDYYGLSWWMVPQFETPVYYMRGILGQYVIVIPELDLVAVRLGHERSSISQNSHRTDLLTYVEELIKTYK